MTIGRRMLLAALLLSLVASAQGSPTTRYVNHTDATCGGLAPCSTTIQAAVTAAQAGDTIIIQTGTYAEQLSISGKNNTPSASEADRIVIEADPAAPVGSIVLTGTVSQCTNGHAVRFQQSKFITLRGLTITGTGGQAIALLGGNNQSQAIHLEGLRIVGNGSTSCNGGITINQGNPDTLIANSLIYGNGRNGITFLDATGGPHWLIGNTIHGNAWSGVNVARSHVVHLVNNLITGNGTATGSTGGRFGVSREASTSPDPAGIQLLNTVLCGNRLGEIDGPALDTTDAGNLTPTGTEGPGVAPSPGCELPATVYANLNGPDGQANTPDDDFTPADGSPAVDHGLDPRTLGLASAVNAILESDYLGPAARPRAGMPGGASAFDVGAVERLGRDTTAPTVAFTQPDANAYVRQSVTVVAQASDAGWVASLGLSAGSTALTPTLSPSPPASTVTATAAWPTTTVADGVYTLTATATDQAGHSTSVTRVVTVDNTPPHTQIVSGPTGTLPATAATFTFTGTDNVSLPASLQFAWRLDGAAFSPFGAGTSATLTGLAAGPHTFEVKAKDQAGNEDPSPASQSFTVVLAPTITALEPDTGPIGTLVTIRGLNLAPTPAGNAARFAGVAAVVRTASTTTLTATVPPSAPTGPVTITTAQGVAMSPMPFTVTMAQDFGLSVAPATASALPTSSTSYTVELPNTGSSAFTGLATLSVDGVPAGVTATFDRATLSGGQRGTLRLTAASTAPAGTASLTVRATTPSPSGPVSRTATATLTVEPGGSTALVGRLQVVDGTPIVGARVMIEGQTVTTDAAGNYRLLGPPAGDQTVGIDTTPFNSGFPIYAVSATIVDGQVTTLPTLWITPPPSAERFTPIANATADQVITDPRFPGLSITLPAGVTIIGWDGQPKQQIALGQVSPNRMPVPPPPGATRALYQVFFGTPMGGLPSAPLPISVPNDQDLEPGDSAELWYYDAAPFAGIQAGWRLAGTATVSADGSAVVADPGVGISRFCGVCGLFCILRKQNGNPNRKPEDPSGGDPVDLVLGQVIREQTDLVIPGRLPLVLARTFNPFDASGIKAFALSLGAGWALNVDVLVLEEGPGLRRVVLPGNAWYRFVQQPDGTFVNTTDARWAGAVLQASPGEPPFDSRLSHQLRLKDGTVWSFAAGPLGTLGWPTRGKPDVPVLGVGLLMGQQDRNGNILAIERDEFGGLARMVQPGGRALEFTLDAASGRVTAVQDPLGRTVQYGYDTARRLETVTDPAGGVTRYTYTDSNGLATITDPRGITFLTNEYDADGRVSRQTQADGGVWTFAYEGPEGRHTQVTVTDPRGNATTYGMTNSGRTSTIWDALGQVTQYERDALGQTTAITDFLGRVTRFEYDVSGNVTRVTDPAGHESTLTYEPTFNRVTSITDALGQTTSFAYDVQGNLTATTDPVGAQTTQAYDAAGQLVSITDALGQATQFEYNQLGELVAITDPLGRQVFREYDAAGRLTAQVDPRGTATAFSHDALNRLTALTDALGRTMGFTYDGNGNLLTVTDPRGNATTHTYDPMDRPVTRTDPLGAAESVEYDGLGNLLRHTDRKGQVATFRYDPLNRRVQASYADGTTTTRTYDAAGRLIEAADSVGGTIANAYDPLDRLVGQTTGLGTTQYAYDAAGRRTGMEAPGQAPVTYGYDAASRLTQVVQASQVVDLAYDLAGRRTRVTLPNGVLTDYQYDAASEITAVVYRNGAGLLGDLTYAYDPAGNRVGVGGSLARSLLPDPVASATYDAASRQRTFGAKALAYDANGNLTAITDPGGVTSFSWDARNRLGAMTGPAITATFTYDALGRRATAQVNGAAIEFGYDGLDVVQDLRNGQVGDYLRTLALDEPFSRSGGEFYLVDALGSAIALTDAAGAVTAEYTYEPFGRTEVSGVPTTNPFQYTGRENDATGLYYYRSRYYHPTLARFISEDLIADARLNPYAYAANSPLTRTDPLGLQPQPPPLPIPEPSSNIQGVTRGGVGAVSAWINLIASSRHDPALVAEIESRLREFASTIACDAVRSVLVCYTLDWPLPQGAARLGTVIVDYSRPLVADPTRQYCFRVTVVGTKDCKCPIPRIR